MRWTLTKKLDSFVGPGEIKMREGVLYPQVSPEEIKRREVVLDPQVSPEEIKRREWCWTLKLAQKRSRAGRWSWDQKVGLLLLWLSQQQLRQQLRSTLVATQWRGDTAVTFWLFWWRSTASSVFRVGARGRAITIPPPPTPNP